MCCLFACFSTLFVFIAKINPVRRILGKSIQDCFLFFGVYLVFLEVFAVPSPSVQKLEENKKNNPVRTILGKSIQDCFFLFVWFIWFFSRFLLSQAQLSKNSRKNKKKQKKSCEKNLG